MSLESPSSLESRVYSEAESGIAGDKMRSWIADEAALLERAARLSRDERLGRLLYDASLTASHRLFNERRDPSSREQDEGRQYES